MMDSKLKFEYGDTLVLLQGTTKYYKVVQDYVVRVDPSYILIKMDDVWKEFNIPDLECNGTKIIGVHPHAYYRS